MVQPCAQRSSLELKDPALCSKVKPCAHMSNHLLKGPDLYSMIQPCAPRSSLVLKGQALCSKVQPCAPKSSLVLKGQALCSKVKPCAQRSILVLLGAALSSQVQPCAPGFSHVPQGPASCSKAGSILYPKVQLPNLYLKFPAFGFQGPVANLAPQIPAFEFQGSVLCLRFQPLNSRAQSCICSKVQDRITASYFGSWMLTSRQPLRATSARRTAVFCNRQTNPGAQTHSRVFARSSG